MITQQILPTKRNGNSIFIVVRVDVAVKNKEWFSVVMKSTVGVFRTAVKVQNISYCYCILRGPGGERIVGVLSGGTELEPHVKTWSWAGCTH